MKLMSSIFLSSLFVVISIESSSSILLQPSEQRPHLVAEASNNFTNKFFPVLLNHVRSRNAIYSPLSVYAMLISFYLGAEGETKNEFQSNAYFLENETDLTLGIRALLDSIERHQRIIEVRTVNDIWVENNLSINQSFNSSIHYYCNVNADVFNPKMLGESLNKIHGKIADETHGLVKDIITMDYLNKARILALSSTYFSGEWAHKFHYSPSTEKTIFHVSETEGTMVNMMHVVAKFNSGRVPGLNADYVELPFKDLEIWGREKAITMFIIRPDSFKDLDQVVSNFGKINISELDAEPQFLDVYVPQFKVESNFELILAMNEVGIQKVFDVRGELNVVAENVSIPIDLFAQKVSLEISEAGANTNSGGAATKPESNDYLKFWVDSPFIAVILDNETKVKIFVARIIHPNERLLGY